MKKLILPNLLLACVLLLSACSMPLAQNGTPTYSASDLNTVVAKTVEALSTQMAPTATQPQPTTPPTNTVAPTNTLAPTSTPKPIPCNRARFIDEAIDDNTVFKAEEKFTKVWVLQNTGTCTWSTNYKLVFVSGDAMSGPVSVNLPSSVAPNGQVSISVKLTAPEKAGTYKGNWKLQSNDGDSFGVEPAGGPFWVQIKVNEPVKFAVTSATTVADKSKLTVNCADPLTLKFTTTMKINAKGDVIYYFKRSDSVTTAPTTITLAGPETETKKYSWNIDAPITAGDYWVAMYIEEPNHQLFNKAKVTITCAP